MEGLSEARSWHVHRFTTQDLYVPWPFGSVEREKTTEERVGVARSTVEARIAFIYMLTK
jgi:hypothetical protein